jgi:hypothetical protein
MEAKPIKARLSFGGADHSGVTVVLQCDTVVLHWCYTGVTREAGPIEAGLSYSGTDHSGVTVVLQLSHSGVAVVLEWCYSGVAVMLVERWDPWSPDSLSAVLITSPITSKSV